MAEPHWRTLGGGPQPTTPAPAAAPAPSAPQPTAAGTSWRTLDSTLAPSAPQQVPSSPPAAASGLPASRPKPRVTFPDGSEMEAVMTTAPKDVADETMLTFATGVTGEGPGSAYGDPGVDHGATAKARGLAQSQADIRTRKAAGETFTLAQEKEIEAQAYIKARGEVAKWYETQTGEKDPYPLLDVSPKHAGINYWLEGGNTYNDILDALPLEVREVAGPFAGMWQRTELTSRNPMGTKTYNEGMNWGGLDWGGRLSLFTGLSNYLGAEGDLDWGGAGHMKSIARGEDLFTQFDQLEDLTNRDVTRTRQSFGWLLKGASGLVELPVRMADEALTFGGLVDEDTITPEGAEKFGDFVVAMGLTLVDPDIWGGIGGSVAKVISKGADQLSHLRNLKKSNVLDDAATHITKLVNTVKIDDPLEAIDAVEESLNAIEKVLGPGARYMLETFTAANLGKEGSASRTTAKALAAMEQTAGARAKLMEKTRLNKEAAQGASDTIAKWLGTNPTDATVARAIRATSNRLDQLAKQKVGLLKAMDMTQEAQRKAQAAGDLAGVKTASTTAAHYSARLKALDDATVRIQKMHGENLLQQRIIKEARTAGGRLEVPPKLKALVEYRHAAAKHLAAAAVRADMEALYKTLKAFTKGRKVEVSPDKLKALQKELRQAVVGVAKAKGPADYQSAMQRLQDVQVRASVQGGAAIATTIGHGVRHLVVAEAKAQRNMDALLNEGLKAKHFTRESVSFGKHAPTVDALREASAKSVGVRGLMGYSVALQRVSKLYGQAAAKGVKNLPEVDQALMRQLGRLDLMHVDAHPNRAWRTLAKGVEGLKRFGDPMRATAGTTDAEVQQILKGGMNVIDTGTKEMAELAQGVTKKGERARSFTGYLDSSAGETILQSTSGTSLWGEALNTLRRLANSPAEEASSAIIDSLARMWTPKGEHTPATMGRLSEIARKFLINKPDATFDSFQQYMKARTAQVMAGESASIEGMIGREMAKMSSDADRSVAMATQAVLHAVALDRVTSDLAMYAADLPPKAIDAMVALSSQDPRRAGEYVEDAMVLLDKLGMPPKLQKQSGTWGKDLKAGFEVLTDPKNDQRFFIPRRWMDSMSGRLSGLVKSGDTYAALNPNPLEQKLGRTWSAGLNVWNRSLLTGLILPIPRYFVAILAGNLSQVYGELGVQAAGGMALRSAYDLTDGAVGHIPFFGEKIRANTIGRFENGLPSAMGTFISPTVSRFFDPTKHKASELIHPAGGGAPITMGEMRKMALKYGILTSFVGQSGMQDAAARAMRESLASKSYKWMQKWSDSWTDMADHIEQRQRVGLFIDQVVNKGMDPKKAAAQTRDALYDWNHPMSQVEMDYFKRVFMFYTFQRKAMGQTMRHLFNPTPGLHNPMSRSVRMGRIHKGAKTMSDQYMEEHYPQDPYNYAWWIKDVGQRTYMGKRPLTQKQREWSRTNLGKDVTHVVNSVSSPSTHEGFSQLRALVAATGKMATIGPRALLGMDTQGDVEGFSKTSLEVLGSMMGRVGEAAVDGVKQSAGLEPPRYGGKKVGDKYFRPLTKPTDRNVLVPMLDIMSPGSVVKDGSKIYVSPSAYMAWSTLLPVFSVELASWLDPIMTREQADNQAMYLTRQISGVMKETPYKAKTGSIRED